MDDGRRPVIADQSPRQNNFLLPCKTISVFIKFGKIESASDDGRRPVIADQSPRQNYFLLPSKTIIALIKFGKIESASPVEEGPNKRTNLLRQEEYTRHLGLKERMSSPGADLPRLHMWSPINRSYHNAQTVNHRVTAYQSNLEVDIPQLLNICPVNHCAMQQWQCPVQQCGQVSGLELRSHRNTEPALLSLSKHISPSMEATLTSCMSRRSVWTSSRQKSNLPTSLAHDCSLCGKLFTYLPSCSFVIGHRLTKPTRNRFVRLLMAHWSHLHSTQRTGGTNQFMKTSWAFFRCMCLSNDF